MTKLPFLRHEMTSTLQNAITDQLLWPCRTVIPLMVDGTQRTILSTKQLSSLETTDPLVLEVEQALAEEPMLQSIHDTTARLVVDTNQAIFRLDEDEDRTTNNTY